MNFNSFQVQYEPRPYRATAEIVTKAALVELCDLSEGR